MKKVKIIFFIAIIFLNLFSCKEDFLRLDNPNAITTEAFWETESDLNSAVATVYRSFVGWWSGEYWGFWNEIMKDGKTEHFVARHDRQDVNDVLNYVWRASNTYLSDNYKRDYIGIFRANQVITFGSQMEGIDETKRKQYIGEAKFLRGLHYFHLANDWGSVPLVLKMAESKEDYFTPKSSQQEVFQQVIDDFTAAKESLPDFRSADMKGRVTKATAIAYLGRLYLYREEWGKVINELEELVNNESKYNLGLMGNYFHLFDGEHENNMESIFEVQFNQVGAYNSQTSQIDQSNAPGEVGGWFELVPVKTLLDAFLKEKTENDDFDPRALATIAWDYPGCIYYQKPFLEVWDEDDIWLRKYQEWWNSSTSDNQMNSDLNLYGMRYADVLLMLAEAYTMDNQVTKAIPLVNRIRGRANLIDKQAEMQGWTASQMMEEIRHQREIEFAREGLHFYDLRRWNLLIETIKNAGDVHADLGIAAENINEKHKYYPLPENALLNNPELSQNEPW